jgi:hypothetical protein
MEKIFASGCDSPPGEAMQGVARLHGEKMFASGCDYGCKFMSGNTPQFDKI